MDQQQNFFTESRKKIEEYVNDRILLLKVAIRGKDFEDRRGNVYFPCACATCVLYFVFF